MVIRRPPLFVSLDSFCLPGENIDVRNRISKTSLTEETRVRYTGWTRDNLKNNVFVRPKTLACGIFDIVPTPPGESVQLSLSSGEKLKLSTFLGWIDEAGYPAGLIFLRTGQKALAADIAQQAAGKKSIVVSLENDADYAGYAACCEVAHWWGMQSTLTPQVSYAHLIGCAVRLLEAYARQTGPDTLGFSTIGDYKALCDIAWTEGKVFGSADIDKLRSSARVEQRADTIKRIIDDSGTKRSNDRPYAEQMISSQGLFWLCELPENDVIDWITYTTFYQEKNLAPAAKSPSSFFARTVAVETLRTLLESFTPVHAGKYVFGSRTESEASEPPAPFHTAEIDGFSILKYPVTVEMWRRFVDDSEPSDHPRSPKTDVSFYDAIAFARLVRNALVDQGVLDPDFEVALPSERQWEAAARGADGREFPWGNSFSDADVNCDMTTGHTTPAGNYSPKGDSPSGCVDMAGNVREWTRSTYNTQTRRETLDSDESEILSNDRIITRGGSYSYDPACVRTWVRNNQLPARADEQTGFRLVIQRSEQRKKNFLPRL